ncbi:cation/H(+) antiporter 15-like [Dorcoceras hygrometricum]|uniref:Cation/H(+) antiporter 15-like n=1 Tax=Dorcoceras hygrometricum TaxID=472368 RepID=A0A2Z7CX62_9LAMI|nr:cation/H(+) antiporter 15-like [Dorcoceras hygrometricum]
MFHSRGFFRDSNPLDFSVPLILAQLSLSSTFILFTSRILSPLGQPSMVIHILAGLVLGPSFLGRFAGFAELVYPYQSLMVLDTFAVFGCMLYFFLIGVQVDPWILSKIERKPIIIGISTVLLALVFSVVTTFFMMKLSHNPTIPYLGPVAIASSVLSFPIVARYLTELKMANTEFGRVALASSLVSNAFGFCMITLFVLIHEDGPGSRMKMVKTVVTGISFVALVVFVVRPIILWALQRNPEGEPLKQSFIYLVLVGIMISGFIGKAAGLNIFYGPLVYGIAIPAGPPLGSALTQKLDFITSWLFMPLYFVKNGLVIDIFQVTIGDYLTVQSVILTAYIGKFLGAMLSSIYAGVTLRESAQIGLVMDVQGVLELGLFKMLKRNSAIDEKAFVVLCASMLIGTGCCTNILRYLYDPSRRHTFHKRRTLLDLKPDSELRLLACVHNQENVPPIINLLESLNPTKRSPIDVCLLHLVELVGRSHPLLIPHKLGSVNSAETCTPKSIINAFQILQQRYYGAITVHPFTAISPYAIMHDEVCEMAVDRRVSLVIFPFHRRFNTTAESSSFNIKTVNDRILQTLPCTTAIVVDRSPTIISSSATTGAASSSSYEDGPFGVAVFFIGGPDDREALAIGSRMVSQPNIHLTIYRLILKEDAISIDIVDSNMEKKLDNEVMDEILVKSRNNGDTRVSYVEQVVRDGTGTVALIRAIENKHEVIIIGRRHDTTSPLLGGLSDWSEDSELGTIGDMFALVDSNATSTILVVKNHITHSLSSRFTMEDIGRTDTT